jgi:hypothetical protein
MMRPSHLLIVASVLAVLATASTPARAQDDGARRGTTFTRDSDVSRYHPEGRSSTEIFILRGTEAKESEKDPGITVETKPADPPPAPKARRGFRGRGTIYTE